MAFHATFAISPGAELFPIDGTTTHRPQSSLLGYHVVARSTRGHYSLKQCTQAGRSSARDNLDADALFIPISALAAWYLQINPYLAVRMESGCDLPQWTSPDALHLLRW